MTTVVLDPGHGGTRAIGKSTPYGARGHTGLVEKDLTLELCRRVAGRLGNVVLTRADDHNISLAERIDTSRRYGAQAFVSVHASAGHTGRGPEVWVHSRSGGASSQLARCMARALQSGPGQAVAVREADLAVLAPDRFGGTAACLVEAGDVDDPATARWLQDGGVDQLADRLARGIAEYSTGGGSHGEWDEYGRRGYGSLFPRPEMLVDEPKYVPKAVSSMDRTRFLQDPVGFAGSHWIEMHGQGFPALGVVHEIKTDFAKKLADHLTFPDKLKVMSDEAPTIKPIYLKNKKDGGLWLTSDNTDDTGRELGPSYFQNWKESSISVTKLVRTDTTTAFFATAPLNGCSIMIGGDPDEPTVVHANMVFDDEQYLSKMKTSKIMAYYKEREQLRNTTLSGLYATLLKILVQQKIVPVGRRAVVSVWDPMNYGNKSAVYGIKSGGNWSFFASATVDPMGKVAANLPIYPTYPVAWRPDSVARQVIEEVVE